MGQNNNEKARNRKQDVDIASILVELKWIKVELKEIKENHLDSIYKRLKDIEEKLNERPTWLMAGIFSLLVGLILFCVTHFLTH